MNSLVRIASLCIAALLLVWAAAAWIVENKTANLQRRLKERVALTARYEALRKEWSQKAQKRALEKFETTLRLYGVTPEVRKLRGKKIYLFTLRRKNADKLLGRLLESPLAIAGFEVEKLDAATLRVRVEVKP